MSGYVRLYRGWRDCDVFADEPMSEREAWLWLIEHAAWKPVTRSNAKGERVRIDRGQLHVSLRALEKVFGWGKNKVARYLERLSDHEMIGTAMGQSGTVLTILNYSKYQDERDSRDTETGTASGQSRDTHKEGKEGKEEKERAPKRARTDDFEIPDWIPAEPWAAFLAMRVRKKAKVDSYIAAKLFAKLEKMAADGWDIAKVIDKATLNNWTDLYTPTPGRDDDMRANASQRGSHAEQKPIDQGAYLASLAAKPWANATPRAEIVPAVRTGGPRAIGDLVQIAGASR